MMEKREVLLEGERGRFRQFIVPPVPMWRVTASNDGPQFDPIVLLAVYSYETEAYEARGGHVGRQVYNYFKLITRSSFSANPQFDFRPHDEPFAYVDPKKGSTWDSDLLGYAIGSIDRDEWLADFESWMERNRAQEAKRAKAREYAKRRRENRQSQKEPA